MHAKKSFGQHFLIQDSIAERLANVLPTDTVSAILEVGPGKGVLTKFLLRGDLPVYAVELDRDLIPLLQQQFTSSSFHLVQGDILRVSVGDIVGHDTSFVLTGNFPYNISSQLVFLCVQLRHQVPFMAGMFQKEMADRICSPPGSKTYGVISVLAQAFYRTEYLFTVKPGSFAPPPKVMSGVISLSRYRDEIDGVSYTDLRRVVKLAFNQRRKKLRNSLKGLLSDEVLQLHGVADLRPEQLAVEQFISLAKDLQPSIKDSAGPEDTVKAE